MKLLFGFLFSILLLFVYTESISYGRFISIRDAPYFVSLLDPEDDGNNVHACGGAIISEYWVITAAHCTTNFTRLMCGESIKDKPNSPSVYHIEKIFVHGSFPDTPLIYDIALIKLKEPIPFDEYKQPIKIRKNPPRENETLVVVGLGDQGDAKTDPPVLRKTEVTVVNETSVGCDVMYYRKQNVAFCAGNSTTDACSGDSGGPGAIDGQLAAIVSGGPYCKNYRDVVREPGLYVRVDTFYDWILNVTGIVY